MIVGICRIDLALHGNRSLKGKRKVVSSVKERVKAKYNVSIAEVDNHDVHQTATLGISVAASDAAHADAQLQKVVSFISTQADISRVSIEIEHHL